MDIAYYIICFLLLLILVIGGIELSSESGDVVFTFVLFILCLIGFSIFGYFAGKTVVKKEAIKNGYAEVTIITEKDGTTSTEFIWKCNKNVEK